MRQLFRFASSAPASSCQLGGGVGLMAEGTQTMGTLAAEAPPAAVTTSSAVGAPPRARRRPVLTVWRKILLTLVGFGVVSAIVGGSMQNTRSSFTASVVNPTSSFTSGTLTMKNDGSAGCTSGNGVVASTCGSFSLSAGAHLAPGSPVTQTITITNAGTLPAKMQLVIPQSRIVDGCVSNCPGTLSQHVNITIHDDNPSTAACLYGTANGPTAPACDSLTNLSGVSDGLTSVPSSINIPGTYQVAGSLSCSSTPFCWAAASTSSGNSAESHTFTFTIEIDPGFCTGALPTGCDGWTTTFDVIWIAQQ
jgi:hypothetical protein